MTSTINIPEVSFSQQAVVPNYPNERHEAIDMTPELIKFAQAILPLADEAYNAARDAERMSLKISDGESSWKAANGPRNALNTIRAGALHVQVNLLARGRNHTNAEGWIDRRDWANIVAAFAA